MGQTIIRIALFPVALLAIVCLAVGTALARALEWCGVDIVGDDEEECQE